MKEENSKTLNQLQTTEQLLPATINENGFTTGHLYKG
jgi:hypothetical protein